MASLTGSVLRGNQQP